MKPGTMDFLHRNRSFIPAPPMKLSKAPRPRPLQPPSCTPPSKRFRIWPQRRLRVSSGASVGRKGQHPFIVAWQPAAIPTERTEMQRSGIFAKQLLCTQYKTSGKVSDQRQRCQRDVSSFFGICDLAGTKKNISGNRMSMKYETRIHWSGVPDLRTSCLHICNLPQRITYLH